MRKYKFPKKLKENKQLFLGTKKMSGQQNEEPFKGFNNEMKYIDLIGAISSCGVHHSSWSKIYHAVGPCDEAIKMFIILLVSKIGEVPDFNDHSYHRLFCYITLKFSNHRNYANPFQFSDVPKLTIEELIEEQILEGARFIDRKRFIMCLNELRSLGHIDDREGRLDTTAFAQFVNAYFFLNEANFKRFIVNLYPDDDTSYLEYLESLKK